MSEERFDWCNDDSVVVHTQPATAVYFNETGAIVIRQDGDPTCNYDQVIVVQRENVPKLVQAILEAADFETSATFGEPLPKPKPLSAAQRQKRHRDKHRNESVTLRDESVTPFVTELPFLTAAE